MGLKWIGIIHIRVSAMLDVIIKHTMITIVSIFISVAINKRSLNGAIVIILLSLITISPMPIITYVLVLKK